MPSQPSLDAKSADAESPDVESPDLMPSHPMGALTISCRLQVVALSLLGPAA